MNLTWKGNEYKEMLWKCAKALTVVEFNKHMDELKAYNKKAYAWLKKIAPAHWSRSHFLGIYWLVFNIYVFLVVYLYLIFIYIIYVTGRANCELLINNLCEV